MIENEINQKVKKMLIWKKTVKQEGEDDTNNGVGFLGTVPKTWKNESKNWKIEIQEHPHYSRVEVS